MSNDPMAFLNAQRAKLAAMSEAAETAHQHKEVAETLGRRMAELDSKFAEIMDAPVVTELTSAELARKSPTQLPETRCKQASDFDLCTVCFDCPCACRS